MPRRSRVAAELAPRAGGRKEEKGSKSGRKEDVRKSEEEKKNPLPAPPTKNHVILFWTFNKLSAKEADEYLYTQHSTTI